MISYKSKFVQMKRKIIVLILVIAGIAGIIYAEKNFDNVYFYDTFQLELWSFILILIGLVIYLLGTMKKKLT